jgi:4-hydroxy-tetrahydrodipicolinate synthase
VAHFQAVAEATDKPIVAYNIPSRCVIDIPNELLRELAQTIPEVQAVKQADNDSLEAIDGLDLLAGNDDILARTMEVGGTGGICVASHLFGNEMSRIVREPESRQEIQESLADAIRALAVTTNPMPIKAAMRMAGHRVGGFRLPMVDLSDREEAEVRAMLERYGLLSAAA